MEASYEAGVCRSTYILWAPRQAPDHLHRHGGPTGEEVVTRLLGVWRLRTSFWERQKEEGAGSPSPGKS